MDGIAKIYTPALYMFIPVNCHSNHAFSIVENFFLGLSIKQKQVPVQW